MPRKKLRKKKGIVLSVKQSSAIFGHAQKAHAKPENRKIKKPLTGGERLVIGENKKYNTTTVLSIDKNIGEAKKQDIQPDLLDALYSGFNPLSFRITGAVLSEFQRYDFKDIKTGLKITLPQILEIGGWYRDRSGKYSNSIRHLVGKQIIGLITSRFYSVKEPVKDKNGHTIKDGETVPLNPFFANKGWNFRWFKDSDKRTNMYFTSGVLTPNPVYLNKTTFFDYLPRQHIGGLYQSAIAQLMHIKLAQNLWIIKKQKGRNIKDPYNVSIPLIDLLRAIDPRDPMPERTRRHHVMNINKTLEIMREDSHILFFEYNKREKRYQINIGEDYLQREKDAIEQIVDITYKQLVRKSSLFNLEDTPPDTPTSKGVMKVEQNVMQAMIWHNARDMATNDTENKPLTTICTPEMLQEAERIASARIAGKTRKITFLKS